MNPGEQLFSEPRTVGANQDAKNNAGAAAASGKVSQITGDETKKDRHTGYADLFHACSVSRNPGFFCAWFDHVLRIFCRALVCRKILLPRKAQSRDKLKAMEGRLNAGGALSAQRFDQLGRVVGDNGIHRVVAQPSHGAGIIDGPAPELRPMAVDRFD